MKKLVISLLSIAFLSISSFAEDKINLAISDLVSKGASAMEASVVSDFLRDALINTQVYNVVERNNMEQILAEQKFQYSGCTSDECAVKMGKLLNVQRMVMGSLSKLGEKYYITTRLVDVESGNIIASDSVTADTQEQLQSACVDLAVRIATGKKPAAMPVTTPVYFAEKGTLDVKNNLNAVEVFVNEEKKGNTPLEIELPAGTYKIKLIKDDKYWENNVVINPKEVTSISPKLSIAPGVLDIVTDPAGAQILIDKSSIGNSPINQSMVQGSYNLKILKGGYDTYSDKITVTPNKTTKLNVLLKRTVIKPAIKNRLGLSMTSSGLGLKWFTGFFAWEIKAGSQDNINLAGGRVYVNFNPRSKAIIYLGMEADSFSGETELQKFKGTAGGAFMGLEVFAAKKLSFQCDLGQYNVRMNNQDYEKIESQGTYLVANVGINWYFLGRSYEDK